jgi:hypothetical protein
MKETILTLIAIVIFVLGLFACWILAALIAQAR